jgi:imidazolonepropionase-like amidohydrolase
MGRAATSSSKPGPSGKGILIMVSRFSFGTAVHCDRTQRTRALAGYERFEDLVLALHRAGVTLAVGTDTRYPGKTVLSEILLLERAGIPMAQTLTIATLGGAEVLERGVDYGAVEAGKKAHLIIFDRNPLEEPRAILGAKTVIKDGRVWQ